MKPATYLSFLALLLAYLAINMAKTPSPSYHHRVSLRQAELQEKRFSRQLESNTTYHEIVTLTNGVKIGRLGAMWWILDHDGKTVSDAYHTISVSTNGYVAELGTRTYRLDTNGIVIAKE
jgi:hypothetical protein